MSIIKPRTRGKQFIPYRTRLDRENHETLYAYAAFLGEDPEYVVNAVIDTVLAKDKEFAAWRTDHPQSCVPTPSPAPKRVRRPGRVDGARTVAPGVGIARAEARDRVV
jgi:hypothetical protein